MRRRWAVKHRPAAKSNFYMSLLAFFYLQLWFSHRDTLFVISHRRTVQGCSQFQYVFTTKLEYLPICYYDLTAQNINRQFLVVYKWETFVDVKYDISISRHNFYPGNKAIYSLICSCIMNISSGWHDEMSLIMKCNLVRLFRIQLEWNQW